MVSELSGKDIASPILHVSRLQAPLITSHGI